MARNVDQAGLDERGDTQALNASLQTDLAAKGMVFNQPDKEPFREALRKAGFYDEWRRRFGDEGWSLLAKASGGSLG